MKKVIIIFCLLLTQCTASPLIKKGDYKLIDTVHVAKNGFDYITGYTVIIKIDSTYWSAHMNENGNITSLDRKLNKIK